MDICKRLGQNVRALREEKGWSQEAFAHEADIHRTYISDIERGARNPTVMILEKLAKPLGVPAARLIE
ncbi:helix-turn-helix domain-containing protein [Rhizorhabdus dicambivorans]|uniref:XRE family transcriptional regulator n=1 Tax=Rhizorhabdus dicambivorans TaxID=1850238 RepID=A0A2A4FXQ3_9SPHN|nr:helix-turn-helix transcriptional regulator [Rhizorhabdus dicambivorans]ATE64192.1 XRE family transcriptional regulator [Rhizorhabdus dicambivorans]PCE42536.1 XRE family transcriptional regulator [Rhizorhabdus dicambivorans]